MAHKHTIYSTDNHFSISGIDRTITKVSTGEPRLMQYDHNCEMFTFEIPKIVDGHDVMTCDKVEIHYINIAANKSIAHADVYPVTDLKADATGKLVKFSWLISRNATQHAGVLNFLVRFVCLSGDVVEYDWHSDIYTGVPVSVSMNNSEEVVEDYCDVIEAWYQRILNERTHWVDEDGTVHKLDNKFIDAEWMATRTAVGDGAEVIPEQSTSSMWSKLQSDLQPGLLYNVYINGTRYVCECHDNDGSYFLGNSSLVGSDIPHNNEPFAISWAGGSATAGMFFKDSTLSSPVKIKVMIHSGGEPNKLPTDFLSDEVALKKDIPENTNIDVVAEVGQTIRVKEVDENGKPTAWESADYLDPLIGTTEEITPTQVMEALTSGRTICITHTTNNFGQLKSNIFTFYPSFNMVCCSGIIEYGGTFLGCELAGFLSNDSWAVGYAPLTTSGDIQYDS